MDPCYHSHRNGLQTRTHYNHFSVTEKLEHFDRTMVSGLDRSFNFFCIYFFAFLHILFESSFHGLSLKSFVFAILSHMESLCKNLTLVPTNYVKL